MPIKMIRRMCELRAEESKKAGHEWSDLDIPEPENPDGPPPKEQFVAYACSCGASIETAEKEYERQIAMGGYGEAKTSDGKVFYDARPESARGSGSDPAGVHVGHSQPPTGT